MRRVAEMEPLTVEVDGIRLKYSKAGRGPAMVLLHGLVGSGRNWEQNISFLARFRTVYALDLANMGESDRVHGLDPGLVASADRLARAMDVLGIDVADVAGHSHGGSIAMMLAARHPDRVSKLVLFAPANPFCQLGRPLIRFYQTRFGMWFAHLIPKMPRVVFRTALSRMYGKPTRIAETTLDGYTLGLNTGSVKHVLGILRCWSDDMAALKDALAKVKGLPTLLIWGDRDTVVGLSSGEKLAQMLGARLVVLPGVGHVAFSETPGACNRAIRSWLRG